MSSLGSEQRSSRRECPLKNLAVVQGMILLTFRKTNMITKNFRYLKWGTEPYKAILGLGFPLQEPYIQIL